MAAGPDANDAAPLKGILSPSLTFLTMVTSALVIPVYPEVGIASRSLSVSRGCVRLVAVMPARAPAVSRWGTDSLPSFPARSVL